VRSGHPSFYAGARPRLILQEKALPALLRLEISAHRDSRRDYIRLSSAGPRPSLNRVGAATP